MNNAIRYITLLTGFGLLLWVFAANFEELDILWALIFLLFVPSPFIAFFIISKKEKNIFWLLPPAILLIILYTFITLDYFQSTSSTAALSFVFAPVIGFILLGVYYLIVFIIKKVMIKT